MRTFFYILSVSGLGVWFASTGHAGSPIAEVICDSTANLRTKLQGQYGSRQQATGIRSPEQVMEVWTGPHGDWTLVVTYASGRSCIVAMGDHWQETAKDPA